MNTPTVLSSGWKSSRGGRKGGNGAPQVEENTPGRKVEIHRGGFVEILPAEHPMVVELCVGQLPLLVHAHLCLRGHHDRCLQCSLWLLRFLEGPTHPISSTESAHSPFIPALTALLQPSPQVQETHLPREMPVGSVSSNSISPWPLESDRLVGVWIPVHRSIELEVIIAPGSSGGDHLTRGSVKNTYHHT